MTAIRDGQERPQSGGDGGGAARIPPVRVDLPAERLARLPNTMKRLREGSTLRIVMLGDSIVNDTARGCWHELVARHYPKCKIVCYTCVRGSTGCWFYRQPGKVEKYVLAQRPDLVVIGGISHRYDVDAIRDCLKQIRAKSPCEFFLMTGPSAPPTRLPGRIGARRPPTAKTKPTPRP